MNQFFTVTHHYNGDVDVYTVECGHTPSKEEVIEALGLVFEPEKGETVNIEEVEVIFIPESEEEEEVPIDSDDIERCISRNIIRDALREDNK